MSKYLNLSYSAIQGSYWMYYGVIMSFASVFLLAKGYSNSEIGVILASSSIFAVILQPLLADIADKSKRISLIGITGIFSAILLIVTFTLYIFSSKSPVLALIFIFLGGLHMALQPLINSMAFYLTTKERKINFGVARSAGSMAYAILTSILGALVVSYGVNAIPTMGILIVILLLVSLWLTRKLYKGALEKNKAITKKVENEYKNPNKEDGGYRVKTEEHDVINLKDFILGNKVFILFTFCIVLIFFQNSVFNNYLMQILSAVGGDSKEMGRLFSFMAVLELPGLIFFNRLRERFSCQFMLKVSSIAFTLKVIFCFMANTVTLIYIGFLFQLISFPIFLSASVHLVDEVMKKGEAVKGQSAITAMMTLSAVFASLAGGAILDFSGPSLLLLISAILAGLGTLIIVLTVDKIKSHRS